MLDKTLDRRIALNALAGYYSTVQFTHFGALHDSPGGGDAILWTRDNLPELRISFDVFTISIARLAERSLPALSPATWHRWQI